MNRIDRAFNKLKRSGKKAFIAYITAGDPNIDITERLIYSLAEAGVDILEVGIPFSDPLADGPTIQSASERALKNKINIPKILQLLKRIRKHTEIPICLMTYFNPVFKFGQRQLPLKMYQVGIDGIIVPDLPPEEAVILMDSCRRNQIDLIFLLSPTSSEHRMRLISKHSNGFIYLVSLTGVTGTRDRLPSEIRDNIKKIRSITNKPVCVGFGISNPKQARSVAKYSDGVIVGSAIIKIIEQNLGKSKLLLQNVHNFTKQLVDAVHNA